MTNSRRERGAQAETLALRYLESKGLKYLARNVCTRWGEIDLVMEDAHTIVFVEVRFRATSHFGRPEETVDRRKQGKIRRSIEALLAQGYYKNRNLRIDVIGISATGESADIEWHKNAFQ